MAAELHSREVKTLRDAVRVLLAKRSPKIMLAIGVTEVLVRLLAGPLTSRDAIIAGALIAVYPFGEWAIHIHLLHLKPFRWRGQRVELAVAKGHRQHHEAPNRLDMVSLDAVEISLVLLVAVPFVLGLASLGMLVTTGDGPGAGPFLTGMITGTLLLAIYEWTHFLIHTAYRPRSRFYRAIWRGHRLHHFKNEHYWHGITSTIADRAFRTSPDARAVPKSRTARTLGD